MGKNSIRGGKAPGVTVSYHPHKPMLQLSHAGQCLMSSTLAKRNLNEPRTRYKVFIKVLKGM